VGLLHAFSSFEKLKTKTLIRQEAHSSDNAHPVLDCPSLVTDLFRNYCFERNG